MELIDLIRQVRRRWRMRLALRGALGVLGLGLIVLLLSAWGLEAWRFTPQAIVTFRIILAAAILGLAAFLLVRPVMRRATDEQVALYLEEHEPSLQAEIISAIEASRAQEAGGSPHSAALVRKLVESAIDKVRDIEYGRRVERAPLRRYAGTIAAVAVAAVVLFAFGPAYLRHALSALLVMSRDVEAAAPYKIEVTPGNASVPRGADQTIAAQLSGFDSDQASLMVKKSPEAAFERVPLVRSESGSYEGMLFDLAAPLDYFVEAAGVRSPVFHLNVVELPYVSQLELEYHFPPHTGLPPQKVEDGGDIAVLKGTEVRVRAVPTMASPGGDVILDDKTRAPLAPAGSADHALAASFKVKKDGFYRVELAAPSGERVPASPQYTIDALADQPPSVSISKPGRDTTASPIEEVFVEASAQDDFGVRDMDLVYSVNGGPEKTIRLFDGRKRMPEVSAGHTFYLEELSVQPGDFVSYYAKAVDNDGVDGPKPAMSDMYFVRVRPLSKDFRRAASDAQQGGGGGGGGGNQVGALSEQQRQIISATFNLQRDRKRLGADKVRENAVVIALSQSRLREQVEGLLTRMNSRLVEQDPSFRKVAELLPQAVTAMKAAEAKLQAVSPDGALPPEQKALQFLQKAEEEYDAQVSMQRQQGGGGGGGGGQMAEDLADLFEMELDKMANQYETRQQASQQQQDEKVDELLEKLKELARRQEQEAERQRRRAALGQQASGGGSAQQQRALAEQAEEAARRLEQLSRDENRADLAETARQLRNAADAMRRAAANGEQASGAQAQAALEQLKQAQDRLQRSQTGRAERDVKDALAQAEEIAREQQEIAGEVGGLESAGERRQERAQQLIGRKNELEQKVGELEKQLDRTAGDIRNNEKDAARKLSEAAAGIRDSRVRDKIRFSGSMVRSGMSPSDTQDMERRIGADLESLKNKLSEAASSLGRSRPDQMGQALDKARQLARGLQSMDQRTKEKSQGSGPKAQGEQGQEGQPESGQRGAESGQRGAESGQRGAESGQRGANSGERTEGGRGGDGDTIGTARPNAFGGDGDRRPGGLSADDVRQFRGEARQYSQEAEQLRRMLQGQKVDAKELEQILRGLRALADERVYQDISELQRLQQSVAESLKRFEFNLRRQSELKGNEVYLSGSDDVPEEFRKLVEQYYKSLSKGPEKKGPGK